MLRWISTENSVMHGAKCLGLGESGVGKTKLISTAPRPFVISAEAGLLSLRKFKIPGLEITTVEELGEAYQWLTSSKEAANFDTIAIDSLSEIAERLVNHLLTQVKDPRQAYAELYPKMETLIRYFRDLKGKHVYMTAKIEPQKDEISGGIRFLPSMPGRKFGPQLPYFFDEVFTIRLHPSKDPTGNHYRYVQTQPDFQYYAKDRSGALDPQEPPDLTHIFTKMAS